MSANGPTSTASVEDPAQRTRCLLRSYFEGQNHLRKGLCLLNAGDYERATTEFTAALSVNPHSVELSRYLLTALTGAGRLMEAAQELSARAGLEPDEVLSAVRLALVLWRDNQSEQAIQTLREALVTQPESAELHYQLGIILASLEQTEEAELRFTQAVALDKDHAEALVNLGLCWAVRGEVGRALHYLQRAQQLKPRDARIGWLLAGAAAAARQAGMPVAVCAAMPAEESPPETAALDELGLLLEQEPEFIDAFLSLEPQDVHADVFNLLAATLQRAVERNPDHAGLHYQRGRVLQRLGQAEEAIAATERAVDLNPRYVDALLHLARLYQQTDRRADAVTRLEQTVLLGAEYADTYYLLGNLYRDTGQLDRARWAYAHALRINSGYAEARQALATLAA